MDAQGDRSMPVSTMDARLTRLLALLLSTLLMFPWLPPGLFVQTFRLVFASALLTYAFMPAVIWLSWKVNALDRPDEDRRVHRQPTPRIGGLAVFLSVNSILLLTFNYSLQLKAICLAGLLVALVSLWDDIKNLPAAIKLLVQVIAVIILLHGGLSLKFGLEGQFTPLLGHEWGAVLELVIEYLLTAIWMIGITNAFNFLDGINGLAAALAAAVCLLMSLLAVTTHQVYMVYLCSAVAGSALGFLPDNARYSRPARAFLGDVGSTYLGWMMAGIAVMGDWSSEGPIKAYAAPLLIFSVMIFDMVYTTIARIYRGEVRSVHDWLAYVGRDHLHHRLMYLGLSQKQSVLAIISIAVITGLAALALIDAERQMSIWLLLGQSVVIYLLLSFIMVRAASRLKDGE